MKKFAVLALLAAAGTASADVVDVNMAGWGTYAGFGNALNSSTNIALPAGTQITNIEYIDLAYTAISPSWMSELVLSVNDDTAALLFWDHKPSATNTSGNFGPASGNFANPGYLSSGPFTMATNNLFVTVYESFNDGLDAQDASITSGILRITYTPVPTPGAMALLGLGGLVATRRRRA